MRGQLPKGAKRSQHGFTMVEFMITAVILAVGILGLTALQVMAFRSNAGSRSLNTSIYIANHILDAATIEGRISWNNVTGAVVLTPPAAVYLNPAGGDLTEYYSQTGVVVGSGATPPAAYVFTAVTKCTADLGAATANGGGKTTLVEVTITYKDTPTLTRTVVFQRRVKSA